MTKDTSLGGDGALFPNTRWTAILSARDPKDPAYRDNLEYLIKQYWKPVYRYVRVGWSKSNEDAKDLTQDFFAGLLVRDSLKDVGPDKGRFRSFLKAALKNFLMQTKRDASRQKRGGGAPVIAIDAAEFDIAEGETPDEAFDREWANSVLEGALARLREKMTADGKKSQFEMFHKFYFGGVEQLSYEQLAAEFGVSKFDVGNTLKAARARLREIALELIGEYIADDDRDGEFSDLFGSAL